MMKLTNEIKIKNNKNERIIRIIIGIIIMNFKNNNEDNSKNDNLIRPPKIIVDVGLRTVLFTSDFLFILF